MSTTTAVLAFITLTIGPKQQPTLDHTAPFLGSTLEITVRQAPALAPVVLYYSPRPGQLATPFGVLEIERASSQRVAMGMTDANGAWTASLPIAATATLAENQAHLQALIDDTSAPAGQVLSKAVHIRLLGPRAYSVGQRVVGVGDDIGLDIVSTLRMRAIAHVDFGPNAGPAGSLGRPVFDAAFSRGAVMISATQLLLFDPFFGGSLSTITVPPSSSRIFTDAARQRVYVLELGGRLDAVSLAIGKIVGSIDLPMAAAGPWCVDDAGSQAIVALVRAPVAPQVFSIARVDLATLQVVDQTPIGDPDDTVLYDVVAAGARAFVSTTHQTPTFAIESTLSRVNFTTIPPQVDRQGFGFRPAVIAPNVAADTLLLWGGNDVPAWSLVGTSIANVTPFVGFPHPPQWGPVGANVMHAQDTGMWILSNLGLPPDLDEPSRLYRLELTNGAWRRHPHAWSSLMRPTDMDVLRDAFVNQVLLSVPGFPEPIGLIPEIFVSDQVSGTELHIPLTHSPQTLAVVPVP